MKPVVEAATCTRDFCAYFAELRDYFEAYGSISSIRIAYDRAGRRRGFGYECNKSCCQPFMVLAVGTCSSNVLKLQFCRVQL